MRHREQISEFASSMRNSVASMQNSMPPDGSSGNTSCESWTRDASTRDNGMRLYIGTIQDTAPELGAYRVGVPESGILVCYAAVLSGGSVATTPKYAPGDYVIVAGANSSSIGFILGSIPQQERYGEAEPYTFITLSDSHQNNVFDNPVKALNKKEANYEVPKRTYMAPRHNLDTGSFSIGSMAGPKFFTDPFMAFLACNDATGVWAFRDNSMLRVAGLNYQGLTAGTYEEKFNDNGEMLEYRASAMNAWEPLGYYEKPDKVTKEDDNWWDKKKATFKYEPKDENLRPYYRMQEFGGWLGQGKQEHTVAPPEGKQNTKEATKEKKQLSLSRITHASNGFIGIESAKGISIVKQPVIPAVQRLRAAFDEENGDSKDTGYDFKHSNFNPKDEPESSCDDVTQFVMAIEDYCAYIFNYRNVSALLAHCKDWYVPETKDSNKEVYNLSQELNKISSGKPMSLPPEYTVKIDNIKHKYYGTSSGIHLTPDGGIVMYDGYGSEIRMSGGTVTISAPGGIWLKSGKDVQLWAGGDLNMRAKGCIDETTTDGSVRIKAEKNLEMLGGNSGGTSGVIIESRGSGDMNFDASGENIQVGGIILKAPKGTVSTLGSTIYTRSGVSGSGNGIMLDAQGGRSQIYTASMMKKDYVKAKHTVVFGDFEAKTVDATYTATKYQYSLPGRLEVNSDIVSLSNVFAKKDGWLGGHILTKRAASGTIFVAPIKDQAAQAFDTIINTSNQSINVENKQNESEFLSGTVQDQFFLANKPGNKDVLKKAQFSFRTDEDLNLEDFRVYEDRWQTVCPSTGKKWKEKRVKTETGKGEYPYPGKKYLEGEPCLVSQALELVKDGLPINHGEGNDIVDKYKDPKYKDQQKKSLSEYRVL